MNADLESLHKILKPPLVTSALFVIIVIIMYLLDIRLSFTFSEQERVLIMSQSAYIIGNIVFSFLGVAICEIVHRSKTYGLSNIRLDRFG